MVKGTAREKALQLQMFRKTEFGKHLKSADPKRFFRFQISRVVKLKSLFSSPGHNWLQILGNVNRRQRWARPGTLDILISVQVKINGNGKK